jgi:exodeoxyribonuclease III
MKIATWNVNSLNARKDRLLAWLAEHSPDALCLQELKLETSAFPYEEVRAAGYHAAVLGQKTYNGVAILSRNPLEQIEFGLDDAVEDPQARLISASLGRMTLLSVYVPNGGTLESDKFSYKLSWLERFGAYLARKHDRARPLVVCGDFNIAPFEIDVARPLEWADSVLCAPAARAAFQRFIEWGLCDCFRRLNPSGAFYSWWDYRQLAFPKGNGLRIDHVLATEAIATRCTAARIDREQRKGKLPSDHAPVIAEFDLI